MSHGFQGHSGLPRLPMGSASTTRGSSVKPKEMLPAPHGAVRPKTPMPTAHAKPAHDQTVVRAHIDTQPFGRLLSIISAIIADDPLTFAEKWEMLEHLQEIVSTFKPQIGISAHQKSIPLMVGEQMTLSSITEVIACLQAVVQELKADVIQNASNRSPEISDQT